MRTFRPTPQKLRFLVPGNKLTASHGSITIQQENLRSVIAWAYGVKRERIKGPGWLDSEEYDIEARAAESASQDRLKLMLQALLAQRFKMALHRMTEQRPVYALIVGKGGSKLHAVDRDPSAGGKFGLDGGFFHKEMVTNMPQPADQLPMFLDGTPSWTEPDLPEYMSSLLNWRWI